MEKKLLDIINEMMEEYDFKKLDKIDRKLNLRDDLNMDSLMLAEFTVRIESDLDIDVFEDGIVETIGDILVKLER